MGMAGYTNNPERTLELLQGFEINDKTVLSLQGGEPEKNAKNAPTLVMKEPEPF
jgi:hypothetical protein